MASEHVKGPARINVIGVSGSGKSTYSARLSVLSKLPRIEMDRLFWKPGWTESTDDEFFPKIREALSGDRWILDGNYSRTTAIKWERVQLVIWLDFSFRRTLSQSIKRAIARALGGDELWPGTGNRESLRQTFFSGKSIVWWMIRSRKRLRERYAAMMVDPAYAYIEFVRLTTRSQADEYFAWLGERITLAGRTRSAGHIKVRL